MAERYRLSVCKGPNCSFNGGTALVAAFREAIRQLGLEGRCEVVRGGCYGMCAFGPNVILRPHDPTAPRDPFAPGDFMLLGSPDEHHYSAMTVEKVQRLVIEHVGRDEPVVEWLHVSRAKRNWP